MATVDNKAAFIPKDAIATSPSTSKVESDSALSSRDSSLLPCPGVPLPANFDKLPILSREQISSRICRGELLILHSPLVYRVPHNWLKLHPGGDHALLHYVGRDAGCEIEAYHTGRTVKERMGRWVVGKVEVDESETGEGWRDMTPPIQLGMWPIPVPKITVSEPSSSEDELMESSSEEDEKRSSSRSTKTKTSTPAPHLTPDLVDPPLAKTDYSSLPLTPAYQAHLRRSHRRLHARIHSLGLDTTPSLISGYGPSLAIYATLLSLSIYTYIRAQTSFDYIIAAVCLGAFWHQITFVAHDTGHSELTGSWWADRLWGVAIADFMGGLSIGWWCDNHNVHHRKPDSDLHCPTMSTD